MTSATAKAEDGSENISKLNSEIPRTSYGGEKCKTPAITGNDESRTICDNNNHTADEELKESGIAPGHVSAIKPKKHPYKETLLHVPEELATMSLGFSIDSGGSVTKLVYRSKEDYCNGIKIKTDDKDDTKDHEEKKGVLRLLHLPKADLGGLTDFLEENCDIMVGSRCLESNTGAEGPSYWYQTGIEVQHYMNELDTRLNIRTRLSSELSAQCQALIRLCNHSAIIAQPRQWRVTPTLRSLPVSLPGLSRALSQIRVFMPLLEKYKQMENVISEDEICPMKPREGFDPVVWTHRLLSCSPESLQDELSLTGLEFPQMFIMIGSAMSTKILTEDGRTRFIDMNPAAGKTVLGVALALTGAKDFDELIEMASGGDPYAADLTFDEMSNKDRQKEEDFYTVLSGGTKLSIFLLGKLAEERYKGTYRKEDIAVGALKMFCKMFAKLSLMYAQLYHKTSIVFVGSFVSHPLIRDLFEECFLYEALFQSLQGLELVKMAVVEHSSHLCALGTWLLNCDMEQNRSQTSSQSSD